MSEKEKNEVSLGMDNDSKESSFKNHEKAKSGYISNMCILGAFGGGMSLASTWPIVKSTIEDNRDAIVVDPKGEVAKEGANN